MNIGGFYNASSMFQSMYNTNSYGSSSMASLTNSVLGGSASSGGVYSALSDRSLIQSGSYGKLLGAYYDKYGDEEVGKSASSTDILEKLKTTKTPAKEETDKVVAETEDGKVVEKADTSDKQATDTVEATKKNTDVLTDLMRRNRAVSYTNMGGVIKNMSTPSFDYIV